jgi:calcium binding protein 39
MPLLDNIKDVFQDRPKSGSQALTKLVGYLTTLDKSTDPKETEKAIEGVAKYLAQLKIFLYGGEGHEITKDSVLALSLEATKTDLLLLLVKHLSLLDFETRKDVAQVFSTIVRIRGPDNAAPGASYVQSHGIGLLEMICQG